MGTTVREVFEVLQEGSKGIGADPKAKAKSDDNARRATRVYVWRY